MTASEWLDALFSHKGSNPQTRINLSITKQPKLAYGILFRTDLTLTEAEKIEDGVLGRV